ncbi:MAG: hypothetical protein KAJ69_03660 [Thermoplasmatales archaeon]|nr:hypothetical protein [Thermoplasmatales archaeon]
MNERHIIVIGIIFVLIFVGLSGCQDGVVINNPDDINIHDKYIRTVKFEYQGVSTQTRVILVPDSVTTFTYHPEMEAYEIHGYIRHNADRTLPQIVMEAKYFDSNHILLATQEQYFYDVQSGFTKDFLFRFNYSEHFETVKTVEFTFNVIE